MKSGIKAWVPLVVLLGALLVLYLPLLIGERVLFWGLPTLQFFPWREFAFSELAAGRIPFWNPYNGAGAPLVANYQTALFYPPNWLHLLLSDAYAMNLLAVAHLFWAGYGMWHFTGRLGMLPLGRGMSTLSYALGGYLVARMGSFPTADAVAWIPWLLWAVLRVIDQPRPLNVGVLSLVTGMLLLVGHAQTAWYALLLAGAFCLWMAYWGGDGDRLKQWRQILAAAAIGVILGVGITAGQLLLTFELLVESQRSGGVSYDELTNLSFSPFRLFNFFAPNFFGSPVDGSYLTPDQGSYFEDAIYIGVIPLLSVIAAMLGWLKWRNLYLESKRVFRTVPFWVFMTIIGIIVSTGRYGPVYEILYSYVPTFDAFREPVRWMIIPVFSLSVLAGIGTHNWSRSPRALFWSRLGGAAGAGMVFISIAVIQLELGDDIYVPVLAAAMLAFGAWLVGGCVLTLVQPDDALNYSPTYWQIAVLLFVAADLVWAGTGLNPTVPNQYYRDVSLSEPQGRLYWFEDTEQAVKFDSYFVLYDYRVATNDFPSVRRSLLPNINMLDEVEVFNNFDPLKPRGHTAYVDLIEMQGAESTALLRAASIGQVYGEVQPNGWEALPGTTNNFQAPQEPPTVWVVPNALWATDDDAITAALLDPEWDPEETVILDGIAPEVEPAPTMSRVTFFDVLRDTPDQKRYRVVTDGEGYMVLAHTWYPGWSVSVDGQNQPLYRANLGFMAVRLPPGGGEVTFSYLPAISFVGVAVSFFAFFLTILLIAIGLIRSS